MCIRDSVLIVLAVISFITDYVIVEPEDRDLTAVLIVGIMVFISGTLRVVQEVRSGNAAERCLLYTSIFMSDGF